MAYGHVQGGNNATCSGHPNDLNDPDLPDLPDVQDRQPLVAVWSVSPTQTWSIQLHAYAIFHCVPSHVRRQTVVQRQPSTEGVEVVLGSPASPVVAEEEEVAVSPPSCVALGDVYAAKCGV